MAGTKAARHALEELQEAFPELRAGICNCRKISGTNTWSQHADCNALDLYHVGWGYSTDPIHQAWLDGVYAWIRTYFDELSIRTLIWRKRDHYNHIHIDFWPKRYGYPSCAGATTSRWQYPSGSVEVMGKYESPDPMNGYHELPDKEMVEVPPVNVIQRGDNGYEVAVAQEMLIALGYDLGNWDPYDGPTPNWRTEGFPVGADGAAGPAFESGVKAFQKDVDLDQTGVVDGVTLALLVDATTVGGGLVSHTHPFTFSVDSETGGPA